MLKFLGLLAIALLSIVNGTRICQRTLAKSVDHVFFMPTTHPFIYVMYSEAERIYLSELRQSYLDTVTYLYSKVSTSPQTPPLYVHTSKILAPTGDSTIYVLHVEEPPGMTAAQENVLYSAFGEFIDLKAPADLNILSCDDSEYSQDWQCPEVNPSSINGFVTYDQRIYNGNTPVITPVTPTDGMVPIGTYATITSCAPGYLPPVTENVIFLCGHIQGFNTTQGWNIDSSMKEYCQPACTELPQIIKFGVITYMPNPPDVNGYVSITTVATLTCQEFYIPFDDTKLTTTCTASATWSKFLTICEPACVVQATIANGTISYLPETNAPAGGLVILNTVATLTCNIGYTPTIASQTTSTCVDVNVWDTELSTCQPVQCIDPTTLFTTQNGKVLTYICPSGTCTGVQPYMQIVTANCSSGDTVFDVTFDNGATGRVDQGEVPPEQIILTCNAQGKWETTVRNYYPPYPPPVTGTVSNPASIICRAYF